MSKAKQVYVVGFLFVGDWDVILIKKSRPAWQKGKLNGVGGHVEEGETPAQAMAREFTEETGDAQFIDWENYITLELEDCTIHFFRAFKDYTSAHTTTDEDVMWVKLTVLDAYQDVLPNLLWLIPLAQSGDSFHDKCNYTPAP